MNTRLQESFAAVYRLLERPRAARRAVVGLLVVHTLLLGYSAYVHSPTLNEPAHLVAGLSHWKYGRFDLYNVNPPLVKMVAALPVMVVGYDGNWNGNNGSLGTRSEIDLGEDFVKANGQRSFFLFMIARWACLPFSWIGAIVCYFWARDLYGYPAGVFAAGMWCLEPNILAHASLITSDVGSAALGLAACYVFWRWLKNPSWRQSALTGVVLGASQLTKTTLILFYPLWPALWLIYRVWENRAGDGGRPSENPVCDYRRWLRETVMLLLLLGVSVYVLNLGYGFEGSLTPLKEFTFTSALFTGSDTTTSDKAADARRFKRSSSYPRTAQVTNRFAQTLLGNIVVPLPSNYLLGIDNQQKDFEHYSHKSYLRGASQDSGWWYFYIYGCLIKVPIGLLLLSIIAVAIRVSCFLPKRLIVLRFYCDRYTHGSVSSLVSATNLKMRSPALRDELVLVLPAIVIFAVVSSKTGFSEHLRYVLPAFPFFYIWNSYCLTFVSAPIYYGSGQPKTRVRLCSTALIVISAAWAMLSSVWLYPHSLSYFNEFIGGPLNGPNHLISSNLDWGQDFRYLQWADESGDVPLRHLRILYYGGFSPLDVEPFVQWPSNDRTARDGFAKRDSESCGFGGCCISATILNEPSIYARDETGSLRMPTRDEIRSLSEMRRSKLIGYSLMIYQTGSQYGD